MSEKLPEQSPDEIKALALINFEGAISLFSTEAYDIQSPIFYDFLNGLVIYIQNIEIERFSLADDQKRIPIIRNFMDYCANSSSYDIYQEIKRLLPQVLRNDLLMAQEEGVAIDVLCPAYFERAIQIISMIQFAKVQMSRLGV